MKTRIVICIGIMFQCVMGECLHAHTVSETNMVVRSALRAVVRSLSKDNFGTNGIELKEDEIVNSWQGFLGRYGDETWSLDEKIAAFDWYLGTLATNDCISLPPHDQCMVTAAISQCSALNYTNSVPYLKEYALNPSAIRRSGAVRIAVRLGGVSDSMTSFVEIFATNSVDFTVRDRMAACYSYAGKVLSWNGQEEVTGGMVTNAVQMLYRNRDQGVVQTLVVDQVFMRFIDGYAASSNRLEFAQGVLSNTNCNDYDKEDFTAITNQLLSSGRPLQWINVGGANQ